MKRFLAVLFLLALCLTLTACGHFVSIMPGDTALDAEPTMAPPDSVETFRERPLMEFLSWQSFASRYYNDTPVAVSVRTPEMGYASPLFDRESIIAMCDALRAMTVTGRAPEGSAVGRETVYTFTMEDGETRSVTFDNGCLVTSVGVYTVSGMEAVYAVPFPGYNGEYDIFDLYFDSSVRAFADGFYQNVPVSVGRRSNGGATLTSKDQAVVSQVFELLRCATINHVEESPDQNIDLTQTTDYEFTLADNTYYTFTFTGPCLTITASEDYGPVYYWLNGVDELPNITILPESTVPTFAGGFITGMREDIAQAQAAANGQLPGIGVEGVYVDYNIQGQHGYLTLSGNTAVSFVQKVTSISADSAVTTPIGEDITVFVTLSDQSGPIIVFTGDTVQQMVGTNHQCDANAMADLRNTILELSKDERNISAMVENATS